MNGGVRNKDSVLHFPTILIHISRSFCVFVFVAPRWFTFPGTSDGIILIDEASQSYTCHRKSSSETKLIFATGEIGKKCYLPGYKWIHCWNTFIFISMYILPCQLSPWLLTRLHGFSLSLLIQTYCTWWIINIQTQTTQSLSGNRKGADVTHQGRGRRDHLGSGC